MHKYVACRLILFDVLSKYRSPGENGETRYEKNDWRDGLRNAIYTILVSLILPIFSRVLDKCIAGLTFACLLTRVKKSL